MPTSTFAPAVLADEFRHELRGQMPVTAHWAYFDHAAVAPLSAPAASAMAFWAEQARDAGDTVWLSWAERVENTRRHAAALVGADGDEIALVNSTTHGINLVAEGVDWRPGDNVVVLADEFPSNLYPWMHQASRGVEARLISTDRGLIDLDAFRDACDERTRVVSFSWVAYSSGVRRNIDLLCEIAKSCGANGGRGAWVFLDAIQGLGVFPLDVTQTPIDFFAADGHKWLLGPEGAGIAFIRRERLEDLRPVGIGWNSVVGSANFNRIEMQLKDNAARYEGGSANMAGQLALGASLEMLLGRTAEVAAAVLDITDYLCERLMERGVEVFSLRGPTPCGADQRSGIVSAAWPGMEPAEVRRRLADAGVAISVRDERLRMSPHAYTIRDDVDRLIDALP
ncbi:MAG: aminotransferase class V-fold PLP-dependent enzyme [Planctomycetota bacterium]